MKIISYNINGIRAGIAKGLLKWLVNESPEVVCFQEIKAHKDQFDSSLFEKLGYQHYWYSAVKKGYSGVGILTKQMPNNVHYGCGILDDEARVLRIDFNEFSIMSIYMPSGTNIERLQLKFDFMDDFQEYINVLKKEIPNLIISGDYNICHKAIDIHDPIRNANVSGFLPHERQWLDSFINNGFIDSFRCFENSPHKYSWWSYRANSRRNNKGWRIDYHMVSETMKNNMKNAYILADVMHSDHCPIVLELTSPQI